MPKWNVLRLTSLSLSCSVVSCRRLEVTGKDSPSCAVAMTVSLSSVGATGVESLHADV